MKTKTAEYEIFPERIQVGPFKTKKPTGNQRVLIRCEDYEGGLYYRIPGSRYEYPITKDMAQSGFVVTNKPEIFAKEGSGIVVSEGARSDIL